MIISDINHLEIMSEQSIVEGGYFPSFPKTVFAIQENFSYLVQNAYQSGYYNGPLTQVATVDQMNYSEIYA